MYTADVWGSACPTLRLTGPLQRLGWTVVRGNHWEPSPQRMVSFTTTPIASATVVILQRDFPRYTEAYDQVMAAAKTASRPVVYELDDLLLETPATHPFAWYYDPARFHMLRALAEADAVTVSTELLRAYVQPINPHVHVLPNCINEALWWPDGEPPHTPPAAGRVRIGYMGGHTHAPDVAMIAPVLGRLLDRYGDGVQLTFFGSTPPPEALRAHPGVVWDQFDWVDYAVFAAYFTKAGCDIFVAPLIDHDFNRFKSAIKFLEYSAMGVPGVYSRITPYEAIVRNGEDGFLATTMEEWESCLVRLIEEAELRQRMGQAALRTVREHWSLAQWTPGWERVLTTVRPPPARDHDALTGVIARADAWWQDLHARHAQLAERSRTQEQQLQSELRRHEHDLAVIRQSPGWQLMQALWPLRVRAAPPGSRRERWALSMLAAFARWARR